MPDILHEVGVKSPDRPGLRAFVPEDGVVYHTYSTHARGVDGICGVYPWLDRAPKECNEAGVWLRHDESDKGLMLNSQAQEVCRAK